MPRFFARALNRKPSVSSLLASEIRVRRFIALRKFVRSVMRHKANARNHIRPSAFHAWLSGLILFS